MAMVQFQVRFELGNIAGALTIPINMTVSRAIPIQQIQIFRQMVMELPYSMKLHVTDDDANTTTSDAATILIFHATTASLPYLEDFTSGFGDLFPSQCGRYEYLVLLPAAMPSQMDMVAIILKKTG